MRCALLVLFVVDPVAKNLAWERRGMIYDRIYDKNCQ